MCTEARVIRKEREFPNKEDSRHCLEIRSYSSGRVKYKSVSGNHPSGTFFLIATKSCLRLSMEINKQ
jgi:hypothetical protein